MAIQLGETFDPPARVNLTDIMKWLSQGDYVVLHSRFFARYFHVCKGDQKSPGEIFDFFTNTRVIYVDVSTHPSILLFGAWNHDLLYQGFNECTCSLRGRVSTPWFIPLSYFLKLGY
jgi:hypothetical protein